MTTRDRRPVAYPPGAQAWLAAEEVKEASHHDRRA
jgi:hypothetical protein